MTIDGAGESQGLAHTKVLRCSVCQGPLGDRWWPHVRAPLGKGRTDEVVHLKCALWCASEQDAKDAVRDVASGPPEKLAKIESAEHGELQKLARELNEVLGLSPNLVHRYDPGIRLCYEELKLNHTGAGHWPPPSLPSPPPAVFKLEGIIEMRISSCSTLQRLPPDIGGCRGLKVLVLIANALVELPEEVGQLVELEQLYLNGNFLRTLAPAVMAIPALQEICIDANWFESLPPCTAPRLEVFTGPANFFTELPVLPPGLTRLEMHGNRLQSLTLSPNPWPGVRAMWDELLSLKLMGNRIEKLPPELALMRKLRILLIANNRLRELPTCLLEMRQLEWIFAYDNAMTELPPGLAHNTWMLERVLLEDNPLSFAAMSGLLQDAQCPGRLKTIGIDVSQVRSYVTSAAAAGVERLAFPTCISVGNLVGKGGPGEHYYMKLLRSSQLRRADKDQLAAGEPGGPDLPTESPADLLVVAFTASQAEPEWLGLLRRIAALGRTAALPAPLGTLEKFLEAQGCGVKDELLECKRVQAALWAGCSSEARARAGKKVETSSVMADDGHSPLHEFDTLCVVDHCMRWYAADADGFANSLAAITRRYQRVLFVGASMGGFGALLHGGRLANAVLAFGPQSRLTDATLRPQAGGIGALKALTSELMESFQIARSRGTIMEVHCAADYHMWHGMQMPLADLALTVHPLCPRKPFARLLDKVGVLVPIVSDVLYRLLNTPAPCEKRVAEPISFRHLAACGGLAGEGAHAESPAELSKSLVAVACWRAEGGFARYSMAPDRLMQLLFGPSSFGLPRAGDWFCPSCSQRQMKTMFFCSYCHADRNIANITLASRVPDGNRYPRRGDWGCGKCGQAMCGYQAECSHCWLSKTDAEAFVVQ